MPGKVALYPGTFDPMTNGHLDIVQRCAKLFDLIVVGVAVNPGKQPLLNVEERLAVVRRATADIANVEVHRFEGLTVKYAQEISARYLLRGLRAISDFEYELQMAMMNRTMAAEIETFFVVPDAQYSFLSSSMIKSIAKMDGDVASFVPAAALEALQRKFAS
ncbi:pantetheine-phosphate adenylyltransferase [Candidatus Sumerlaeota bacterium]